jgi:hypothetical protein
VKIINLTPHEINIFNENGDELVMSVEPSGTIARIATERERIMYILDVPIFITKTGQAEGLPEPKPGIIYIVSGMFRSHAGRSDLYQPGELLRDDEGRPIGCIGLSQ